MDDDLDSPRALDVLDAAATLVLAGGRGTATLREALSVLGFAFAGRAGPRPGTSLPNRSAESQDASRSSRRCEP